jgi:hypothetical protein
VHGDPYGPPLDDQVTALREAARRHELLLLAGTGHQIIGTAPATEHVLEYPTGLPAPPPDRRPAALVTPRSGAEGHQGTGPASLEKPPDGPSAGARARRTMTAAPCVTVRVPRPPFMPVAV